jgi:hypothetical protein
LPELVSDERAFCKCGEPYLRRKGICLSGHRMSHEANWALAQAYKDLEEKRRKAK